MSGEYSEYYQAWIDSLELQLDQMDAKIQKEMEDADPETPVTYSTVRNRETGEEVTIHITKKNTLYIHFDIDANQTTTKHPVTTMEKAREYAKTLL
ncbi:hypothetical protein [Nostoc phage A1]|nr:hypothetical protein [Nostoc phage A1]